MTPHDAPLAPIRLRASVHPIIWGGRNLETIAGKTLPAGEQVGETWETATDSVAENAPYTGKTLGELVTRYGERLIGARAAEIYGLRFPLLAKFIDAQDKLSVQVHPNDAYASAHEGGKLGKTEAWYILRAEPGAEIVYGVSREITQQEARQAIAENRLEDLLRRVVVRAGDVVFVPAGAVHAIGAGVVLYELQEYSDITYRLYDYGRRQANGQPRELHLERGLEVMDYAPPAFDKVTPHLYASDPGSMRRTLVGCRYFVEEEARFDSVLEGARHPESCQILTVLDGACVIKWAGEAVPLGLGQTAVLPAGMGAHEFEATSGARLLRSYAPEEKDEQLAAWRQAQSVSITL